MALGELPTREVVRGGGADSSSDTSRSAMNASSRFFLGLIVLTGVSDASDWGDKVIVRTGARWSRVAGVGVVDRCETCVDDASGASGCSSWDEVSNRLTSA